MVNKVIRYLKHLRSLQRINIALSRAAATAQLRRIDDTDPNSWEFCGFSQHGEDGIIDYLTRRLKSSNRYFIEIGCADGLENNSSWLALGRMFGGMMIDGNPEELAWCRYLVTPMNYGVDIRQMFMTRASAAELIGLSQHPNPDVFSLDIDGNDYFVAEAILKTGLRPKIWVVEYNSAFGPDKSISIRYQEDFRLKQAHGLSLYSGCSVAAWRRLFAKNGYQFVTVDLNGVNAFFIDPAEFGPGFAEALKGGSFRENFSHSREYRTHWPEQFALIKDMEFEEIT